jgi:hypothetical protein
VVVLAVVALVCGTVLLVGHRAERVLTAKWRADRLLSDAVAVDQRDRDSRLAAIAERDIALREQEFAKRSEPVRRAPPMPDDIRGRITMWDDEFAQNDERARIADLFAELGDWDQVRKALPALSPFLSADNIAAPREGLVQ